MPSNADRRARTGTCRDGHAPENARTDAHGMSCVCRYAPAARLVRRAARHVDCRRHRRRPGRRLSKRDVSGDTGRSCVPTPVFLNTILHGITRAATLGPPLPLVHHVSVSFVICSPGRHSALLFNVVMGVVTNTRPAPAQIISANPILTHANDESPPRHVRALCGLESATQSGNEPSPT
jgi:hypothetical protein